MGFRRVATTALQVFARPSFLSTQECFASVAVKKKCTGNAFTAFMKHVYKTPKLKDQLSHMPIPKRGKLIGKWFRALPAAELAQLQKAGAKITWKRKVKGLKKVVKPTAYTKFIKKQMAAPAIKKLDTTKRFAAIAKLWNKQKH